MSLQSPQRPRMSEERLEIIEKLAHQQTMPLVIELCHEIRRLQTSVSFLAALASAAHRLLVAVTEAWPGFIEFTPAISRAIDEFEQSVSASEEHR